MKFNILLSMLVLIGCSTQPPLQVPSIVHPNVVQNIEHSNVSQSSYTSSGEELASMSYQVEVKEDIVPSGFAEILITIKWPKKEGE